MDASDRVDASDHADGLDALGKSMKTRAAPLRERRYNLTSGERW